MISIGGIYDKDVNFLFGSGASFGLLPTLKLSIKASEDGDKYTLEELATKFEQENDARFIPLFMHYYASCIRPAELLSLKSAGATDPGKAVIANYHTFVLTVLEMVKRRRALDRRCNVFTTNYDGCFPIVADALLRDGSIDFVLNDGSRGFTQRVIQARNFGAYLCQSGVFGRYQSSIPQINLIHLHGSVYWSKWAETILVDYDLSSRTNLLDADTEALLKPFSDALNSETATLADLAMPKIDQKILDDFWKSYQRMPIVNPTKWKFHETVYEEHYYQMLRLLSYELEKSNAVLITFGFSFADEHILNLVTRSLSNPGLQVFVCCFDKPEQERMQRRFQSYRNVKCIALEDGPMDFTAFNNHVLAWPEATAPTKTVDDDTAPTQEAPAQSNPEAGTPA
ncbi:SIR2 family protein [Stenotrophomonas sp.]|uniref:SIR2 family protein n=1 Tax=Stenotrophomonas sp. TaxID=69392 RepID=UPI00289E2041|nr:SIR2 family protein [Stenotrophomonas sp.]